MKLLGQPPYTAAWIRKHPAQPRIHGSGVLDHCEFPFPFLLEGPVMFQAFVTPEETLFLYADGAARHIYTDGRKHPKPADLWPTALGNSVGHREGTTLVIDTIEIKSGPIFGPGTPDLSARAHFIERVHMIDRDTLQDDLTIDGPLAPRPPPGSLAAPELREQPQSRGERQGDLRAAVTRTTIQARPISASSSRSISRSTHAKGGFQAK